jgi:Fe-S oxidoreductase
LNEIIQAGGRRGALYGSLKDLRDRYAPLIRSRFPRIPRRISGYNLDQLLPESHFNVARALVGTEGTCVTVLEAVVRLVPSPKARPLVALAFSDLAAAADHVMLILRHKPIALEGIDRPMLASLEQNPALRAKLALLPEGDGLLLAEFGAESQTEAVDQARGLVAELQRLPQPPVIRVFEQRREAAKVWEIREAGLAASSRGEHGQEFWGGWEDAAVPPERLGAYLRDFQKLMKQHHYRGNIYGHFGQGCIHVRINFDLRSKDGLAKFRNLMEQAAELVVSYGGSLSGEHGDGQARAELYPKMFGPDLVQAFREFKAIWDPKGKMNPGKLVDPYRMDENLRLGPEYNPPRLETRFGFSADGGNLEQALLRCVGIGACRREGGGTMCPSYMVTREEQHSTRGRARLLFEMLHGGVLGQGWRDSQVRDALDLCLACKGCKNECPVNVDMATYKAEFLAHHYQGRLRPLSAYAFGLIFWWARMASQSPRIANAVTQFPAVQDLVKAVIGIAPERRIRPFAARTFRAASRLRSELRQGPEVILWPDTFNNFFTPHVAQAALETLEAAGFRATIPQRVLCCGRPLYDYGMLNLARRKLRRILDVLRPWIMGGTPVVFLEPSCHSVFVDELGNLFPQDKTAALLRRQSFLLGDFLAQRDYQPPALGRKALVHGHCHQRALAGMAGELAMLERMGVSFELLDSGCCGMAGGFGYEKAHYDVSVRAGERVLLPAVRSASPETLIVASGFSCREQIEQITGRPALHLAEVIQMSLKGN